MSYKKQNQKGISLVETIIYVAIFSMVSILVINSFITVMGSFTTTRANRYLLEAGINSMERMSREIREANSIDLANSILNEGTLYLNNTEDMTVKRFSKESGMLNLYECEGLGVCSISPDNIIGDNIFLDNLVFRRIIKENGEALKIEMTLRDLSGKTNKTENFYNTIILRGGY